ncbi:uncharacterized protein L3040_000054 [Drepanopeziza brunnea f. sp. 'multigermtubi']|uniref:Uncharacterized protein n=1 Tax=Marssonina brunnea f. sp. multigermtubi (strain MB_m1) TaxID=1072389 RepID=K1X0Z7_MARBU|nr:uncharacterized protein MBM_07254 [Drepanopeziza brunnea f. sp. 'multigermtubi' MB_m1]EKD14533.1 hypothetical protein MBM_07254 [Drepanopeziza brunnea f. sp. 'multigermtubi' MB_m1]KAJ5053763.1 hypothetical protein L3040_000054 [Drepanopeziza brunnea f. sp. 'multigermtubi']
MKRSRSSSPSPHGGDGKRTRRCSSPDLGWGGSDPFAGFFANLRRPVTPPPAAIAAPVLSAPAAPAALPPSMWLGPRRSRFIPHAPPAAYRRELAERTERERAEKEEREKSEAAEEEESEEDEDGDVDMGGVNARYRGRGKKRSKRVRARKAAAKALRKRLEKGRKEAEEEEAARAWAPEQEVGRDGGVGGCFDERGGDEEEYEGGDEYEEEDLYSADCLRGLRCSSSI